jgi:predicted DNA-binding transcriptional regulator YafY
VAESIPVRTINRAPDGTVTDVVLDVAGMAWFERLVLQLGRDAQVLSPPELTDLASRSALKVLKVYQKDIK